MIEKMKAYLDELFAALPDEAGVREAKEELYAGMVERYNDNLRDGMDEQEAYDAVIDSVGDIKELFEELRSGKVPPEEEPEAAGWQQGTGSTHAGSGWQDWEEPPWRQSGPQQGGPQQGWQPPYEQEGQRPAGGDWSDELSQGIEELAKGVGDLVSGFARTLRDGFGSADMPGPEGDLPLSNSRVVPLEGISAITVSYHSDRLVLGTSPDDTLIVNEYFKKGVSPTAFARINVHGGRVDVKTGNRFMLVWPTNRIEILLPASWGGSLQLSTISGSIQSEGAWRLSSLQAKSVSGKIQFEDVSAGMMRLSSTSGSVLLGRAAGNMELSSVSGSIKVEHAEGLGSFKSTSSSIRVNFAALGGPVEASTVSGGVRLNFPPDASFELDARSVSGNVHTAFDHLLQYERRSRAFGFVGPGPHHMVRINTTSGGIHIND